MSYSIAIGSLEALHEGQVRTDEYTCQQAYKACMPSFVFSIAGQVGFRGALEHLLECNKRDCVSLRKKVREGINDKIDWLFDEEVLLGCVLLQPTIYKAKRAITLRNNTDFGRVAHHLSRCPHESCARLRRAILLTIRDRVSPNAHNSEEQH